MATETTVQKVRRLGPKVAALFGVYIVSVLLAFELAHAAGDKWMAGPLGIAIMSTIGLVYYFILKPTWEGYNED